mgnify:CR=1 FL=1
MLQSAFLLKLDVKWDAGMRALLVSVIASDVCVLDCILAGGVYFLFVACQLRRFCATGTMGIIGNLTSGEIMEQLVYANSITRIRNVVFMGMGEPL